MIKLNLQFFADKVMLIAMEFATLDVQSAIGAGITSGSATRLVCGEADGVAGGTGRVAGTDNACSVVWRGLENWWGNITEYVDGANINNGHWYTCLNQLQFADDTTANYTDTGITWSTSLSLSYSKHLTATLVPLPDVFGGSSTTYLCDGTSTTTGWATVTTGGYYGDGALSGIWCLKGNVTSAQTISLATSRLMYVPAA